eukprot:jgi/Chrzof1/10447/UNPLg00374.t1
MVSSTQLPIPPLSIHSILTEFLKQNPYIILLCITFLASVPLSEVFLPHQYGKLTNQTDSKALLHTLIIILTAVVFIQIAYGLSDFLEVKVMPKMLGFIRHVVIERVFAKLSTNYEEVSVGQVLALVSKLPNVLWHFIDTFKTLLLPQTIAFVFLVGYFAVKDPAIAGVVLVLLTGFVWLSLRLMFTCEDLTTQRDRLYDHLHSETDDVLRNMATILSSNQQSEEQSRLAAHQDEYNLLSEQSVRCALKMRYTFTPVLVCFLSWSVWHLFRRMQSGGMSRPSFVSCIVILLYCSDSMWKLVSSQKDLTLRYGIIQSSLQYLNEGLPTPRPAPDPQLVATMQSNKGLALRDVSLRFGNREIFHKLNLHFKPGQRCLIVGRIGSGKSTLLKLLTQFYLPTSGEVFWDSTPFHSIPPEVLRRQITYVPQNPILFSRTIYDNITYRGTGVHAGQGVVGHQASGAAEHVC